MNARHHLAAAVLLGAAALAPLAGSPVRAADTTTVRVGATGNDAAAEVYYADELGLFKKRGLEVQISQQRNGAASAAAVAGGALDIGEQNVVSMTNAHSRGLPFVYIAPAAQYTEKASSTNLLVAKNSPIKSAKDLDGKTVGVNALNDLTQIAAEAWIDKNGGQSSSVHFIEMTAAEIPPAIARGTIQAGVVPEPALSMSEGETRVLGKQYSAIAPEFMINGWFATSDWVKKNPAAAKKFADAIVEAAAWANAHHAESAKILEKHSKIEPAVIERMTRATYATKFDPKTMQEVVDTAVRYKAVKSGFAASEMYAANL